MTRNPRDERDWTNKELEADSAGYLAAQAARRKDEAASVQKRRDADDLARFEEAFVAAGGYKSDAAGAFKASRNQEATTEAQRADREAITAARQRIRSSL